MKRVLFASLLAVVASLAFATDANAFFFRRNVIIVNNNVGVPQVLVGNQFVPAFSAVNVSAGFNGFNNFGFVPNNSVFFAGGGFGSPFIGGFNAGFGFNNFGFNRFGGVGVGFNRGFGFRRGFVGGGVGFNRGFVRFR